MRKWLYGGTIILWIVAVGTFIQADLHHRLISLIPIIAYNRPQGLFGWSLVSAVILTGISVSVYRSHQYQVRMKNK